MLDSLNRYGLTGPLVTVSVGGIVLLFLHAGSDTLLVVDSDGFGPVSWPRVALYGVITAGLLWGTTRFYQFRRLGGPQSNEKEHDNLRLLSGVIAVTLYGATMVYIGFAIATFLFLLAWFLIGGLRSPLKIFSTSLFGTLAFLYLFLKIAYLPLPRGTGFMDNVTVSLYRLLGIF